MSMTNENTTNQNASDNTVKFNMQFILDNIVKIMNDTKYITDALENLSNMPVSQGPGDVAGQGKAQAIGKIVESREETNRQILKFLEYMYDDLKEKE